MRRGLGRHRGISWYRAGRRAVESLFRQLLESLLHTRPRNHIPAIEADNGTERTMQLYDVSASGSMMQTIDVLSDETRHVPRALQESAARAWCAAFGAARCMRPHPTVLRAQYRCRVAADRTKSPYCTGVRFRMRPLGPR